MQACKSIEKKYLLVQSPETDYVNSKFLQDFVTRNSLTSSNETVDMLINLADDYILKK
jgi:hypothetical protein